PAEAARQATGAPLDRPLSREVAFDQVQRPRRSAIGDRRQLGAATADGACQPQLQHQSLYPAASDPDALPVQLLPDLLRTVDLLVLVPDSHDLDTELLVALRVLLASFQLSLILLLCVVGRRSDRQYIAD